MSKIELEDLIVRRLARIGCACAPDLANEVSFQSSPAELLAILESLEAEGLVRRVRDPQDARKYDDKYQRVYELAR